MNREQNAPPKRVSVELTVGAADTAKALGSGSLEVLATPRVVALMENAAMLCAQEALEEGMTTVGAKIDVDHLKPTALGRTVVATATCTELTDGRFFTFAIEVTEDGELVAKASHKRVAVNGEKFMARLKK